MTVVIGGRAPARDAEAMHRDVFLPDFDQAPFLVIWEATRACALACVHCRADAIHRRDPRELTTEEGFRLIDQVRAFGERPPLFVLTGGDPMRRPDLADLVGYAAASGLTVALTPSGTAAATKARLSALKDAGLSRLAVSLDGPTPESHDAFRGVRGSYMWTMRIIEAAIELGLPLQINSTISRRTLPDFEAYEWNGVFVPTGTSPAIIAKLNAALNALLDDPVIIERFRTLNVNSRKNTPDEFRAFLNAEMARWSQLVKDADIKLGG